MRHLLALVAVLALVLTACAEGNGGASPGETLDIGGLGTPGATGMDDPGASPGATGDDDMDTDASPGATGDDDDMDTGASPGATGSPDATRSPGDDDDDDDASPTARPSPGTGTGTGTAGDCEEAFDDVPNVSRIDSLSQLQQVISALDATIEACESLDEWTEQAETQLNLGNLNLDAESFLRDRCETRDLEDTALCEDL